MDFADLVRRKQSDRGDVVKVNILQSTNEML